MPLHLRHLPETSIMNSSFKSYLPFLCIALTFAMFHSSPTHAQSRVTQSLDFESIDVGSAGYLNGSTLNGAASFDIDGFQLSNYYYYDDTWGTYWTGFAISNHGDVVNGTHYNQYSSITGGGAGDSSNFAVGYMDAAHHGGDWSQANSLRNLPSITLPMGAQIESLQITNTTYATSSITLGDEFASPFGPGDYFEIAIYGIDANDLVISPVSYRLADYVSATSPADGIVLRQWETLELQGLSGARSLHFALTTTVSDMWGPLTPLSFAVDNLNYSVAAGPEPSSIALCSLLLVGGYAARRKRRRCVA